MKTAIPGSPPSFHALRAFEAAARLGAFNRAAIELNISPTAISHHIRGLESDLDTMLFVRAARGISLTEAGEKLARVCTDAFAAIDEAVAAARKPSDRSTVSIALGPNLAARWLSPRLSDFWAAFPDVDLRLIHTPTRIDPATIEADIVIAWGEGNWPGAVARKFLAVSAVAIASPGLIESIGPLSSPSDVLRQPLIHQRDHADWRAWFASAGVAWRPQAKEVVIEDANVVLRSCIEGQGIALGWLPLVSPDIESGRVVQLFDLTISGPRAYYLCEVGRRPLLSSVGRVIEWLGVQLSK